jgi:hypothetical protein
MFEEWISGASPSIWFRDSFESGIERGGWYHKMPHFFVGMTVNTESLRDNFSGKHQRHVIIISSDEWIAERFQSWIEALGSFLLKSLILFHSCLLCCVGSISRCDKYRPSAPDCNITDYRYQECKIYVNSLNAPNCDKLWDWDERKLCRESVVGCLLDRKRMLVITNA